MKASVIIPTKNPGPHFQKVLTAVLSQSTAFDYEVLVIDSGSTDGTLEYVKDHVDPRVRLHRIEPAAFGHGRTRNLGVSMTSGQYAVLITHDAMPVNGHWLASMVATADSDPQIAGVFGRHIAYPDADPFTARELEMHFAGFDAWALVSLDDPPVMPATRDTGKFSISFPTTMHLSAAACGRCSPTPTWTSPRTRSGHRKLLRLGTRRPMPAMAL